MNLKLFLVGASVMVSLPSLATDESETFKNAERYTVRVGTAVTTPFEAGDRGSFFGAGMVVDAERGWVLTNRHVVRSSPSKVSVAFRNRDYVKAQRLYLDHLIDLAIVVIDPNEIRAAGGRDAPRSCNAAPPIGLAVGAYGHPGGFTYTATRGVISSRREVDDIGEMLQTDAAINPGNSGGPLIALAEGKVIGMNTLTYQRMGNTSFALPMSYACRVIEMLKAGRDPSPPQLDVKFYSASEGKEKLKVARSSIAFDKLPLYPGDVILGLANSTEQIANEGQLRHALRGQIEPVHLRVRRGDAEMVVTGRLPLLPPMLKTRLLEVDGMLVGDLQQYSEIGHPMHHPWIRYVEPGSEAGIQDVMALDRITEVDGQAVASLEQVWEKLQLARELGRPARLVFKRRPASDFLLWHEYLELELPLASLRWIGHPEAEGS